MKTTPKLLALVSTAFIWSLCHANSASAAIVGTFNVGAAGNIYAYGTTSLQNSSQTSGVGLLDSNGTFTMDLSGTVDIAPGYQAEFGISSAQVAFQDTFTGSYMGGVFTPTGGSSQLVSCIAASQAFCAVEQAVAVINFTNVGGSIVVPSGGTVNVTGQDPNNIISDTATYTVSAVPAPPVPLPPSAALLGFGLLSLFGATRRPRTAGLHRARGKVIDGRPDSRP